jgi:hypothetical protein
VASSQNVTCNIGTTQQNDKVKEYFGLQCKMINRKFKDSGLEPLLAYILLTALFVGLSVLLFRKTEFAEYIYLFVAFTFVGKLSETKRTEFLKICFGDRQLKKIRIVENLICSISCFSTL